MKTVWVSFHRKDEHGKWKHLGGTAIDMYQEDKLCLEAKAFRQATPEQQLATKIKIDRVKIWH